MEARKLLGWNLRRLRVERGLSQKMLAKAAGIDPAYMGRVERAEENVTLAFLERTAEALSAPIAELFAVPESGATLPARLPGGRPRKVVSP